MQRARARSSPIGVLLAALLLIALVRSVVIARGPLTFRFWWGAATAAGLIGALLQLFCVAVYLINGSWPAVAGLSSALLALSLSALAGLVVAETLTPEDGVDSQQTGKVARKTRMAIVIVTAFAIVVLFAPYTSEQVGDLLLAWADQWLSGAAMFGIAATLLLGLVMQESSIVLIDQDGEVRRRAGLTDWRLGLVCLPLLAIPLFVLPGEIGVAGLIVLAFPLALAAAVVSAELALKPPAADAAVPRASGASFLGVAVLPLVVLAAAYTGAVIDALFVFGPDDLTSAAPPLLLLIIAVVAICRSTPAVFYAVAGGRLELALLGAGAAALLTGILLALDVDPGVPGALVLAALVAYAATRRPDRLLAPALTGAIGLAVVPWVLAAPLAAGEALGTIALVALTLALVFSLLHYLSRLFELVPLPRRVGDLTGIHRVPVLAVLAVWVIVAFSLAAETRHDVELVPSASAGAGTGETLDAAFASWVEAQPELAGGSAAPVPLVVVAAHGGGARSAYWTAAVLDRIAAGVETNPYGEALPARGCDKGATSPEAKRIFLISSVSGGSVGAYAYSQELERAGCLERGLVRRVVPARPPRAGRGLGPDARPARRCCCTSSPRPAADAASRAACWTGRASSCGIAPARWRTRSTAAPTRTRPGCGPPRSAAAGVPLVAYNSTSDDVQERIVLSRLRVGDIHRVRDDAIADMCGADVPELSAAILSARFPVVTPTGRLFAPSCEPATSASAVDGGYLENAGVATLADVLPQLEELVRAENERRGSTRIVIVALEIANVVGRGREGEPTRTTSRPPAPSAPQQALLHVTGASEYISADARAHVRAAVTPACFAYVQPPPARGWRASVGWRLSRAARQELESAIATLLSEASSQRVLQRAIRLASDPFAAGCMNNGLEAPES